MIQLQPISYPQPQQRTRISPAVSHRGEREQGSDAGRQAEPDQGEETHAVAAPHGRREPQGWIALQGKVGAGRVVLEHGDLGKAAGDSCSGSHDAADDAEGGGRGGSGSHIKREVDAISPGE